MRVSHVALASSSEEKADRFYQGVLKLKKTRTVTLPASIMKSIFGLDHRALVFIENGKRNGDPNYEGPFIWAVEMS